MQPIHILYISGFGDKYDPARRFLLGWWRFRGVTTELVPMNWASDELLEGKISRINQAIDENRDKRVVIIGESAGGSMAMHVYAARSADLYKVMTLCGKNTTPETVSPHLYEKYPAFKESMAKIDRSVESISVDARQQFTSIHPVYDPVVPVNETLLPGCKELILPGKGHLLIILGALTIWSGRIVRAIDERL